MKKIAIYWDVHEGLVNTAGGGKRWLSMFLYSAEAFGFDEVIVIGTPNIQHGYKMKHKEFPDLETVLSEHQRFKVVALSGNTPEDVTPIPLARYQHPRGDALYLVGGDYGEIEFDKLTGSDVDFVTIENKAGLKHLWSPVVAGIALFDAYKKG